MHSNRTKLVGAALVLSGALAACSPSSDLYFDRRDSIHLTAGDANASNIAVQTIDPWPQHAANRTILTNGEKIQPAIQRYKEGKVIPPQGLGTSSIQVSPSAASNEQK